MNGYQKRLCILGSTGSVGTQTLEVVRNYPDHFKVVCLGANRNTDALKKQILEFLPKAVSCEYLEDVSNDINFSQTMMSLQQIATHEEIDTVVVAVSYTHLTLPTKA